MSWTCDAIEAVLALQGQAALDRDSEMQQHVDKCSSCQATLAALGDLDRLLGELPEIEPPAATVATLLQRPELATATDDSAEPDETTVELRHWGSRLKYSSAAVAALLGLTVGAFFLWPQRGLEQPSGLRPQQPEPEITDIVFGIPDTQTPAPSTVRESEANTEPSTDPQFRALGYLANGPSVVSGEDERQGGKAVAIVAEKKEAIQIKSDPSYEKIYRAEDFDDSIEVVGEAEEISVHSTVYSTVSHEPAASQTELEARLLGLSKIAPKKAKVVGAYIEGAVTTTLTDELKNKQELDTTDSLSELSTKYNPTAGGLLYESPRDTGRRAFEAGQEIVEEPNLLARRFLQQLRRTDELHFQSPTGYWSNSYLPGDSALRLLRAQLEQWDRSTLEEQAETRLRLHDAAQPLDPPFDAPRRAALALNLNADHRQVDGESRVLLQVGLRSTDRRSGQRPAMNIAVVLDFTEVPTGAQIESLRALLFALDQARQPGDRFHLLTTFEGGELRPEEFRHGPLHLFLGDLTATAHVGQPGAFDPDEEDLRSALSQATDRIARGDDPTAPWGSSSLLLLTDRWLGGRGEIANLARRNAVAGLALSTVALGDAEQAEDLEPLALAGQGRRWWIGDPSHAAVVARREVEAVGQVVARALRLNIRLAAGVRLVEIHDSQPLNALRSEQVRQGERAIDLRLARNLGIASDRDRDDEGIQIVIPAFQADDSHTVLLDLVVPGPGAVAEVTLRYKDLVRLRNGTAREQLNLRAGQRQPGPLQLSVLRGRLKIELRESLRQAAEVLFDRGPDSAAQQLQELRSLLAGLGQEIPALAGDRGLDAELAMIDEYLVALATDGADSEDRQLADSLRYAGQLGIRPPPTPVRPD